MGGRSPVIKWGELVLYPIGLVIVYKVSVCVIIIPIGYMYKLLSFLYRWRLICINKWISYTYIRNDTIIYENDTNENSKG